MYIYHKQKTVRNIEVDLLSLQKLEYRALILTSESEEYDFVSRYFAPKVGIYEDPVCVSAHCRLVPYWSNKLGKQKLIAFQESSRGGKLICKNNLNNVSISGKAVTVFKGQIFN
jgi:predicted PhzF superfamily epimerase YddE/YHI9